MDLRAIDDTGDEFPPITLSIGANETRHFKSEELEEGNTEKELSGGVGEGQRNWRLGLEADLDVLALASVRTGDGSSPVSTTSPRRWSRGTTTWRFSIAGRT